MKVSSRISQKIGFAPLNKKAFTVDEKVKDGVITSSPGSKLINIEAISKAVVPDVVSSMLSISKRFLNCSYTSVVYFPSPDKMLLPFRQSTTLFISFSVIDGLLNLIILYPSRNIFSFLN